MSLLFRGRARDRSVIVVSHQGVGLREKGPKVNINQAFPQIVETINQGERKVQYSCQKYNAAAFLSIISFPRNITGSLRKT